MRDRSGVSAIRCSRRAACGAAITRMPTVRSPWSRYEETLPSRLVWRRVPMSAGVRPVAGGRRRSHGETASTARPPPARRSTSTTPGIFSMVSAISVAFCFEHLGVGREDLDLARVGRPGQVADQVAQHAGKLGVQGRLGVVDLLAQLVDHLLGAARAVRPELDQEVARVRLGDGQGQPGAGAPREALHLGSVHAGSARRGAACGRFRRGWCRAG